MTEGERHLAGVVAGYDKTGHPRNLEMVFPIIVAGCGKSQTGDFAESTQDQSFPWQDTTQKPCFGGELTRILGAFQGLYTGGLFLDHETTSPVRYVQDLKTLNLGWCRLWQLTSRGDGGYLRAPSFLIFWICPPEI